MTQGQIEDLFDIVFKIRDKIDDLINEKTDFPSSKYHSARTDAIYGALSEAQGQYSKVIPSQDSPRGKYANLDDILSSCRTALKQNELCFTQYLELEDAGNGARLLKTIIGHSSGQWLASYDRILPCKTDIETGNRTETIKRTQAMMLLGVAPSLNDPIAFDDNGVFQAENVLIESLKKPNDYKPKSYSKEVISKDNYNDILIEIADDEAILQNIRTVYGIDSLADLPKDQYLPVIHETRRLKQVAKDFSLKNRR